MPKQGTGVCGQGVPLRTKIEEKPCRRGCEGDAEEVLQAQLYWRGYWRQSQDTACAWVFSSCIQAKRSAFTSYANKLAS